MMKNMYDVCTNLLFFIFKKERYFFINFSLLVVYGIRIYTSRKYIKYIYTVRIIYIIYIIYTHTLTFEFKPSSLKQIHLPLNMH